MMSLSNIFFLFFVTKTKQDLDGFEPCKIKKTGMLLDWRWGKSIYYLGIHLKTILEIRCDHFCQCISSRISISKFEC